MIIYTNIVKQDIKANEYYGKYISQIFEIHKTKPSKFIEIIVGNDRLEVLDKINKKYNI